MHGETLAEVTVKQENDLVSALGCLLWQMIRIHPELIVATDLVRKDVGLRQGHSSRNEGRKEDGQNGKS